MSSRYVKALRQIGAELKERGYPVSGDVCFASADRMQRMEACISLSYNEFVDKEHERRVLDKHVEAQQFGEGDDAGW